MSGTSIRQFNMVVFGATGCTGKHVIVEIVQTLEALPPGEHFTWAIAGRSVSALEKVLADAGHEIGKDLSKIKILIVDVKKESTVVEMAKSCDIVVNCVGPYTLFGEPVVRACADEGTHHVDISAEALFNHIMYQKYNKTAEETGAVIVGACGYCCIPSDYASTYLENNFDGELNSIDSIQGMEDDNLLANKVHYGTYHSVLLLAHRMSKLEQIQRELFPDPLPDFKQKHLSRIIHYNEDMNSWCVTFPHPDKTYLAMTQQLRHQMQGKRPFQTHVYFKAPSIFWAVLLFVMQIAVLFFAYFKPILNFLLNHPKLCSLGLITREEPTKEELDVEFSWTLVGKGWDTSVTKNDNFRELPPNKKIVLRMKGRNPAYGATSTMLVQSAVTILKERNKLPSKGGVFTPGIAFSETKLAERLHKRGFTFTLEKPIITSSGSD